MPKTLVSVIITTFDRPAFLKEAIASVLQQDFGNFELIIIDDCSPGLETQKAVESFNDKRIRYIRNQINLGSTTSLNNGLGAAKGKYVAILDDDDIWINKEKISRQLKFLEENPHYSVVGCKVNQSPIPKEIKNNLLLSNPVAHSSVMYRREKALDVGGYDKKLARAKDWDLTLKLGMIGDIKILPDCYIKYRELSWKRPDILKIKADDCIYKIKVIWRHHKEYPYAKKAMLIEIYRYIVFTLLRPFSRLVGNIKD